MKFQNVHAAARNILMMLTFLQALTAYCQVVDSGPSGRQNILPVEGAGLVMQIDTVTPLDELIKRLNGDWEFIETGKGYWIGYTNDMFSIAAHGDEAIPRLVEFFRTAKSEAGKSGAIYTLHLIGINRTIVGRFSEKFVNPKAREALLSLLPDKQYAYWIMELLMRDPWQSDVPRLFEVLSKETDDDIAYPVINALKRYDIKGLSLINEIPDTISDLNIKLDFNNDNGNNQLQPLEDKIKLALKQFSAQYPDKIKIDEGLYAYELTKYGGTSLDGKTTTLSDFISILHILRNDVFGYCIMGNKLQYFYKDGALQFITIKTARKIANNWWASLSDAEKQKFKKP